MQSSSRVKKSIKNVSYGLLTQAVTIALNFSARIILVRILGREANGLNGLFTEVIAMLSLAEMGVGTAIVYSLYKPLAEQDHKKISELMWLFKIAYRIIAAVVFLIGLALTPFIQYIVKETGYETSYIQMVFLLFVIKTASSYLFSYKSSLLIADQKIYIVSNIMAVSRVVCTLFDIVVLIVLKSFVAYLIVAILFNLLANICIAVYAKRQYPYIHAKDRLPKKECIHILSNIRHIFISKLSGKITNSTDNILVSVLVNTVATGIYSNYALIMTNIKQVFGQVMNAMAGSFGNLMVTETPLHCDRIMRRLTFMFFTAGMIFGGGLIASSEPLITLCFGADSLLDTFTLIVCSYNLFLFILIFPLWHVMSISGLFAEDKKTSLAGSGINLIVSLILGKVIGMAGIFIGTSCTILIQLFWKAHILYAKRLGLQSKRYIMELIKMLLLAFVVLLGEKFLCDRIIAGPLIVQFFLRGTASVIISAVVIWLFYGRSSVFEYFYSFIKGKLKRGKE